MPSSSLATSTPSGDEAGCRRQKEGGLVLDVKILRVGFQTEVLVVKVFNKDEGGPVLAFDVLSIQILRVGFRSGRRSRGC